MQQHHSAFDELTLRHSSKPHTSIDKGCCPVNWRYVDGKEGARRNFYIYYYNRQHFSTTYRIMAATLSSSIAADRTQTLIHGHVRRFRRSGGEYRQWWAGVKGRCDLGRGRKCRFAASLSFSVVDNGSICRRAR